MFKKVNNDKKVLSPENVLTTLLLQNVVEYKMLNHYDLFREQRNVPTRINNNIPRLNNKRFNKTSLISLLIFTILFFMIFMKLSYI
jgi:hypothetical protein